MLPQQEQYRKRLGEVKLGPREAGALTWNDALARANGKKLSHMLLLNLGVEPPQWNVAYTSSESGGSLYEMSFAVDANTGLILKADYVPFPQGLITVAVPTASPAEHWPRVP